MRNPFRRRQAAPEPITETVVEPVEHPQHVELTARYDGPVCFGGDGWYYPVEETFDEQGQVTSSHVDRDTPLIFVTAEGGGHYERAQPHHVSHFGYFGKRELELTPLSEMRVP